MSDDNIDKRPTHIAYHPREGENKSYFNRIGSLWPHKDGEGYNMRLDSIPVDGRIVIRTAKDRLNDMREQDGDGRESDRNEKRSSGREDRRSRDNGPRYER